MTHQNQNSLTFTGLTDIRPAEIISHMNDARIKKHLPLLTTSWGQNELDNFIKAKQEFWHRDGLGHWAFLYNNQYVGWGGFQKEGEEWDYGLVLKPEYFGLGAKITRAALKFARLDNRIPYVTFLLPPSRKNQRALLRLGARFIAEIDYNDEQFLKYRLETSQDHMFS